MKVYGIIGWQNSGKTTLVEALLAEITGRGYSVSTIKHAHHDVDLDRPGKDSWRHRQAGATEVVLATAHRFALMREYRGPEPRLEEILARLAPVDLVLIEGYKRDLHPKIEVFRDLAAVTVPQLDLNDPRAVADFILRDLALPCFALGDGP